MKLRLFLFLACTLLAGRAIAQGCSTNPIKFPDPGAADKLVPSGTCIANADGDSPTGQGGRLRWDNDHNHQLDLFDSDDGGTLMWCANSANTNGGSSGPTNCLHPPSGSILCLQQDGNMVIYKPSPGQTSAECDRTESDSGVPVWDSGTDLNNNVQQQLLVAEEVPFCPLSGGPCTTANGDRAAIINGMLGYIWVSLGYSD